MTTSDSGEAAVRVEIWADVQCVWCYFGEARFRQAAARFDGEIPVVRRSFELMPGSPVDGDARAYLQDQRGMSAADQQRAFDQLRRVAAAEGLPYEPSGIQMTNSRLALEALHHADAIGAREALSDRLYRAYFAESRRLGRVDDLVALAAEAGLDPAGVRDALTRHTYAEAVDRDNKRAQALGVRAVPFYAINNTWGLAGAQSPETFLSAFARAAQKAKP